MFVIQRLVGIVSSIAVNFRSYRKRSKMQHDKIFVKELICPYHRSLWQSYCVENKAVSFNQTADDKKQSSDNIRISEMPSQNPPYKWHLDYSLGVVRSEEINHLSGFVPYPSDSDGPQTPISSLSTPTQVTFVHLSRGARGSLKQNWWLGRQFCAGMSQLSPKANIFHFQPRIWWHRRAPASLKASMGGFLFCFVFYFFCLTFFVQSLAPKEDRLSGLLASG